MKAMERRVIALEARVESGVDWRPVLDTLTDPELAQLEAALEIIKSLDPETEVDEAIKHLSESDVLLLTKLGMLPR